MIEDTEIVKLILEDKVTLLCRPAPLRGRRHTLRKGRVHSIHRKHGEKAATRILIRDVRPEKLGKITLDDARRAGAKTVRELLDRLTARYGCLSGDSDILLISFVRGEREKERYLRLTPPRFDPHAEDRAETDDDRGYTSVAARGAPGRALDDPELEMYAKQAHARHHLRRTGEWTKRRKLTPADRLRQVGTDSQRLGVDIGSETRLIEQRLRRAERDVAADKNASA